MYFEIVSQEGSLCEIEKHLIEYKKRPFFSRKKISSYCDRDRIQTYNLLIRSQMLYSVELRGHPYAVTDKGFKPLTF